VKRAAYRAPGEIRMTCGGTKCLQRSCRSLEGPTRVISATPQSDVPSKPVKVLFAEDEVLVRLMMAEALRGKASRSSRLRMARRAFPF
jgi:hypothetical protein